MGQIVLRYPGAKPIKDLIAEALKGEENELSTARLKTKERLTKFENKYHLSTADFISASNGAPKIDDLEAIEWEGERETLRRIEENLSRLKGIEVCT